jgi:hypothetical protein
MGRTSGMTISKRAVIVTRIDGSQFVKVPLKWTPKIKRACKMVSKRSTNPNQIAAQLGISPCVVRRWTQHPAFRERADVYRKERCEEVAAAAMARVECRIAAYQQELDAINGVMQARAESMKDSPMGRTGRMVVTKRRVGAEIIEEYTYDHALVRRKLEILKQVAQDLGQWPG